MFVSESINFETNQIRPKLNFKCFDSGNLQCQSGANKRYYNKMGKFSLKIHCFAKSCRKGCAGPATKEVIYESWGANKPPSETIERNSQGR